MEERLLCDRLRDVVLNTSSSRWLNEDNSSSLLAILFHVVSSHETTRPWNYCHAHVDQIISVVLTKISTRLLKKVTKYNQVFQRSCNNQRTSAALDPVRMKSNHEDMCAESITHKILEYQDDSQRSCSSYPKSTYYYIKITKLCSYKFFISTSGLATFR